MAYIRVIYNKEKYGFDYVSTEKLDTLIMGEKITHFYRPAEKRWINPKIDPLRGNGGLYRGPERREIINGPAEEAEKRRKDERNRSSNWLNILWRHFGNL